MNTIVPATISTTPIGILYGIKSAKDLLKKNELYVYKSLKFDQKEEYRKMILIQSHITNY